MVREAGKGTRSGGSRPAARSRTSSTEHPRPVGDRGRAGRRPVVHQLPGQLDRADHHPRHRHELQAREHPRPAGITAGPDGALWFTNRDSIGRITTGGTVTSFRHASIGDPWGITAGPDGALWFTNIGATRSGGSPPAAPSRTSGTRASAARGRSRRVRTAPSGSPTMGNSIGRITTGGKVSNVSHHENRAARGESPRAGRHPLVHQ